MDFLTSRFISRAPLSPVRDKNPVPKDPSEDVPQCHLHTFPLVPFLSKTVQKIKEKTTVIPMTTSGTDGTMALRPGQNYCISLSGTAIPSQSRKADPGCLGLQRKSYKRQSIHSRSLPPILASRCPSTSSDLVGMFSLV